MEMPPFDAVVRIMPTTWRAQTRSMAGRCYPAWRRRTTRAASVHMASEQTCASIGLHIRVPYLGKRCMLMERQLIDQPTVVIVVCR